MICTSWGIWHCPNKHITNLRPHKPKWKEVWSISRTRIESPTSGQGEVKSQIYSAMWEKRNGPDHGISTASNTTDRPSLSALGDHMKRKEDKEDQPSGEETTWTNTGATRSDRGLHKTWLTWRRHHEAFAQPRDTKAAQRWWWWLAPAWLSGLWCCRSWVYRIA